MKPVPCRRISALAASVRSGMPMVRFDPYIRIGPRALTLPVAKVIAEVLVVFPKVNEPMLLAADATARPTSRRLKAGVAVKPVALKDVISTAPVVLMARPLVDVTSKTSARRRIEAEDAVTADPAAWPSLAVVLATATEIFPPARSTSIETEPEPESSWTSVTLMSEAVPEVVPRIVTVPAPVAAMMIGKPAAAPSCVPTLFVAPVPEPVKRISPLTVR